MITFLKTQDVPAFTAAVRGFLLADEVFHNLLLGILADIAVPEAQLLAAPGAPVLAYAEGDDGIEAVAVQVPPRNLVVSQSASPVAIEALARGLAVRQIALPGVFGPARESRAFAAAWRGHTLQPVRHAMGMELGEATEIHPPSPLPPGRVRRAEAGDTALVAQWLAAFNDEAETGRPDPAAAWRAAEELVAHRRRSLSVWEDGDPPATVSMAAIGAHTGQGARVFAVYTPPERRRHGYASACVAAISREVLDSGCRYVSLFYDRSNLTAAHIYQELGYVRIASFDDYRFG
ncbi:MAG TPA: GNAT family N-acetyltransferase [Actinomycetota bacterium]|nr:GNAT family N-acetyltransferase [Actinomycetota bacterium]